MRTITSQDPGGSIRGINELPEFLQAALEWLPVGILLVGGDGVIMLANREIERLFGYVGAELIGRSVDALVPDASRAAHGELRQRFVHDPHARGMGAGRELNGRRKDGSEVPVEVGLTPIQVRDSLLVLASVIDVSTRRHAQNEVQRLLNERLDFEALVSELGAEFVNLRSDEVDRHIEDALGRIVRTLDIDRSALFHLEESGDLVHTHQWTRPGCASPPPRMSAQQHFPWLLAQIRAGDLVSYESIEDVPNATDRESLRRLGTKSNVTVPLAIGGRVWGAVSFATVREGRNWSRAVINRLRVVALIFANVLARKQADDSVREALATVAGLRDRLRDENAYLRRELLSFTGAPVIVGHSSGVRRVLEQVRQVASTDSPVLLIGETGTGKALLAARIHELSGRGERAMVRVNCASLSAGGIESELFGSDRGSYGDAEARHVGRLELANSSTVFLDEIADLPAETQATLTRVLQERQLHPPGSARPVKVDIRIIAATRRDLTRCIAEGTFRDDLYYRINVFPIHVPPLRERPDDIPLLVWRFVDEFAETYGKPIDTIDSESMAMLQQHAWPGNARELRNVVERAMIVSAGRRLRIPLPTPDDGRQNDTLIAVEKRHITSVLAACGGRIHGKHGAAARLGLTARALEARMARLRVPRPAD